MAKKFAFVCLGILALTVAYHVAAPIQTARSQEGECAVFFAASQGETGTRYLYVMTDMGNVYKWDTDGRSWDRIVDATWPGTPATAMQSATWGQIKARFEE